MQREKDDHWIAQFSPADFLDIPRMARLSGLEAAVLPIFHVAVEGWIQKPKYPFSNWQVERQDKYKSEDIFYATTGVNLVRVGVARRDISSDRDSHFSIYTLVTFTEGKSGQSSGAMENYGVRQLRKTLADHVQKCDPAELFEQAREFLETYNKQFYLPREISHFFFNDSYRAAFGLGGPESAKNTLQHNPGFLFPEDRT